MSEQQTRALDGLVIGILGGTGPQGRGLARRFAMAGHQVIIGSRPRPCRPCTWCRWRCPHGPRRTLRWPGWTARAGSPVAVAARMMLDAGAVTGDLPPRAQLMIKHEISAARGRAEYPWAYVTSWADPDRILGNSSGDATVDPAIRAGRPIVVEAGTIIDWAIWIDGKGIVEGGQTNVIAQG
jgi:NAD(P)-dependent dehydrogenase (short-subunit alcohol dehydrogenase family)